MKPRFLVDENVAAVVKRQLLRHEPQIDVLAVGDVDAPPLRTEDPDLLRWIEETGYILVSWDRRTMPGHIADHYNAGGHVPGVLLIRRHATIGQIVETLRLIWSASDAAEYRDRVQYIPFD